MYRIKLRTAVPFEYSIFAVAISRHRGAKQFQDLHPKTISLLSPAYLLFIVDIFSTQQYRFTKADFHPCLTHKSNNQVNLCLCTQKTIEIVMNLPLHTLDTFFEGDRPSQTYISVGIITVIAYIIPPPNNYSALWAHWYQNFSSDYYYLNITFKFIQKQHD